MKQICIFLMLSVLSLSVVAKTTYTEDFITASTVVTGNFEGQSHPSKMNGKDLAIGSIISCPSTFIIDNNYRLSGAIKVPVVGHSFQIRTIDSIKGLGSYEISGFFVKKGDNNNKLISGNIIITKLNNNELEFKCIAILNNDNTTESIFTFSGTHK